MDVLGWGSPRHRPQNRKYVTHRSIIRGWLSDGHRQYAQNRIRIHGIWLVISYNIIIITFGEDWPCGFRVMWDCACTTDRQTDRQTDRRTHHITLHLSLGRGNSNKQWMKARLPDHQSNNAKIWSQSTESLLLNVALRVINEWVSQNKWLTRWHHCNLGRYYADDAKVGESSADQTARKCKILRPHQH